MKLHPFAIRQVYLMVIITCFDIFFISALLQAQLETLRVLFCFIETLSRLL